MKSHSKSPYYELEATLFSLTVWRLEWWWVFNPAYPRPILKKSVLSKLSEVL